MKAIHNQLIALACIASFSACNSASTDTAAKSDSTVMEHAAPAFDLAQAKTAIEAQNTKFSEAFKKGDSAAMASNYSSDAVAMPPNMPPVQAKDLAGFWGGFMKMGIADVKLVVDNLVGNADLVAETGHAELYDAKKRMVGKAKYVVVWKPENGTWKMYRDIWNEDSPPPAPSKGKK
jgi:ketosteroid isomerase-like protein